MRNRSTWSSSSRSPVALPARPVERGGAVVGREHVDQPRRVRAVRLLRQAAEEAEDLRRGPGTSRPSCRYRALSRRRPRRRRRGVRTPPCRAKASKISADERPRSSLAPSTRAPPSDRSGRRRARVAPPRTDSGRAAAEPRRGRRWRPPPRVARARASAGAIAVRSQRSRLTVAWSTSCAIRP